MAVHREATTSEASYDLTFEPDEGSALLTTWRARERRHGAEQALRDAARASLFGGRWLTRRANQIRTGGL